MFGVAIDKALATPNNGAMNTEATKIIEALGDTAEVARLFDIKMPSVSGWKELGIPRARMMYLKVAKPEVLTGIDVEAATAPLASSIEVA